MSIDLPVSDHILRILRNPRFEDESTDDNLDDALYELANEVGWIPLAGGLVTILKDMAFYRHWYDVAEFIFACDCRRRAFPCESSYLIALLYDCLHRHPDLGDPRVDHDHAENLVWSIAHHLKGLADLAPYDPRRDPQVLQHRIER